MQLDPLNVSALGNGCELLRRFDRFDEALDWADRQLALGAESWAAHLNRGVCLFHLRRFDEAEAAYDAARRLDAGAAIIHWEAFPLYLHQERFAPAWAAFEQRFACGDLNGVHCYPFAQPPWRGEPLAGRRVLIHNEQGLGDQLMFASALAEVVDAAAEVTLICSARAGGAVRRLLPRRAGAAGPQRPFCRRPPAAALAGGAGADRLPAPDRRPDAPAAHHARELRQSPPLPAPLRRRAGPVGRTAAGRRAERRRLLGQQPRPLPRLRFQPRRAVKKSMTLETLQSAGRAWPAPCELVSVLNWRVDPTPPAFVGRLDDLSAELKSLDDTAALIETLDVVVTVDTSVATTSRVLIQGRR